MFTGIIADVGSIASLESLGGDARISISVNNLNLADETMGASIAVNGVCLTLVEKSPRHFSADVSLETLARTTLGKLEIGNRVNLESALRPQTALGGHLVSGHVDGVATVVSRDADARSERFVFSAPTGLARYIATKGSVCLDGVSLTVNEVDALHFGVNIVPHTLANTIMGDYKIGSIVNLEVDIIARYLERLLNAQQSH
ncbi:MAG: riboflavin synthase [Gammaproteobacteria bacterium]|nr:riboflavin synthase [Gammaproteobacteria bacterium]